MNIYKTLDGKDVPIKAISPTKIMRSEIGITKMFRAKGEPIDPPTYEVETVGGGKETHILDETAVMIPGDEEKTAERQALWDAHTDACQRMKQQQYDTTRKIVLDSIDLPLPADESWIRKQEELFIEIPEDLYERWIHWLETEILLPQDIIEIVSDILTLSTKGIIPEEDVEAATELFRRSVYTQARGSEEQENTVEADAEKKRALDAQPDNVGDVSGESVGDDA